MRPDALQAKEIAGLHEERIVGAFVAVEPEARWKLERLRGESCVRISRPIAQEDDCAGIGLVGEEKVATKGRADEGRKIYESGKGTCIACHQIGDKGRSIGPNLSKIGAIRTERDIVESILFPSNTLARDYETHVIETNDGQNIAGVIKSHTAEGLLVVDVAGVEHNISHDKITADTQLMTSLMPMGLDQTLQEQELCDLIAWLRSLK